MMEVLTSHFSTRGSDDAPSFSQKTLDQVSIMFLIETKETYFRVLLGAPNKILHAKNAPGFFFLIKDSFFSALHSCHFCSLFFSVFVVFVQHCLRFVGSLWIVRCGEGEGALWWSAVANEARRRRWLCRGRTDYLRIKLIRKCLKVWCFLNSVSIFLIINLFVWPFFVCVG